jgi:FkbM family methyltransferase
MTKGDPAGWLAQRIGPGDIVFDVGANVGHCAEQWLKTGAKVICLEPDRRCWDELKVRAKGAEILHAAAAAFSGHAELTLGKNSATSSLRPSVVPHPEGVEPVVMMTLDEIRAKATAVKIDVQGCELDVLNGADELLETCKLWVIEIWPHGLPHGVTTVMQIYHLMGLAGLSPYTLDGLSVTEVNLEAWATRASENSFVNLAWMVHGD